jgi:hypothetical protein
VSTNTKREGDNDHKTTLTTVFTVFEVGVFGALAIVMRGPPFYAVRNAEVRSTCLAVLVIGPIVDDRDKGGFAR